MFLISSQNNNITNTKMQLRRYRYKLKVRSKEMAGSDACGEGTDGGTAFGRSTNHPSLKQESHGFSRGRVK
ncbi:MAG: hypothetical protein DRG27_06365 [Deltaproteobacteria bacterium]|nr:MAG: hypothetical protein DRG27_06365 [Deltaproteobacteria bacterium]